MRSLETLNLHVKPDKKRYGGGLSKLRDLGPLTGLSRLKELNLPNCQIWTGKGEDKMDSTPLKNLSGLKKVTLPKAAPDWVQTELESCLSGCKIARK